MSSSHAKTREKTSRSMQPSFAMHLDKVRATNGQIAYVGKRGDGHYEPFVFEASLSSLDVELSEDVFIVQREVAAKYRESILQQTGDGKATPVPETPGDESNVPLPTPSPGPSDATNEPKQGDFFAKLTWSGSVPPQKWMNFYTRILTKYAGDKSLSLRVSFDTAPENGISKGKIDETKSALRELGLDPDSLRAEE